MILKSIKTVAIGAGALALLGGVVFGTDIVSYVSSSTKMVQSKVKNSVPLDFELQRARDLLDDIIPEIQTNVRLIAREEVEIEKLKDRIQEQEQSVAEEETRIARLRDALRVQKVSYTFGGHDFSYQQVKEELANRFDRFKEAKVVLATQKRLLDSREKSLQGAMRMLEKTRTRKTQLANRIEAMEGQYRLVKAASTGSKISVDNSKLAQTEKLIDNIKTRLDVAERVLAHEARFVETIPVDTIDEQELLAEVDSYLDKQQNSETAAREVVLNEAENRN